MRGYRKKVGYIRGKEVFIVGINGKIKGILISFGTNVLIITKEVGFWIGIFYELEVFKLFTFIVF